MKAIITYCIGHTTSKSNVIEVELPEGLEVKFTKSYAFEHKMADLVLKALNQKIPIGIKSVKLS